MWTLKVHVNVSSPEVELSQPDNPTASTLIVGALWQQRRCLSSMLTPTQGLGQGYIMSLIEVYSLCRVCFKMDREMHFPLPWLLTLIMACVYRSTLNGSILPLIEIKWFQQWLTLTNIVPILNGYQEKCPTATTLWDNHFNFHSHTQTNLYSFLKVDLTYDSFQFYNT